MKAPLRYQITQYDCGPTSTLNALSVLFDREELQPELLNHVYTLMLDKNHGAHHRGGTSEAAMSFFAQWLNGCHKSVGWPIEAMHLHGEEVHLSERSVIVPWVDDGGVAVVSCSFCGTDHYVLLDGFQRDVFGKIDRVSLFDPLYLDEADAFSPGGKLYGLKDDMSFVRDEPFFCNRSVSVRLMEACEKCPYSLSCNTPREATLLRRSDKERKTCDGRRK